MERAGSLLAGLDRAAVKGGDELFTTLARSGDARIERIVSHGQASPEGFWYDQAWDEYVLVVAGAAIVEIAGEPEYRLNPGDWLMISARKRHRVVWTTPEEPTVWLAVHIGEGKIQHD